LKFVAGATLRRQTRFVVLALIRTTLKWLFSRSSGTIKQKARALLIAGSLVAPYLDSPKVQEDETLLATFWPTAIAAALLPKKNGVYIMQHYEEVMYPDVNEYKLVRMLVRLTYDLPLIQSSNSKWLTEQISKTHGVMPALTQTNGIPPEFLKNPASIERGNSNQPLIVAYARPEPWKGLATTLEAFQKVKEKYPLAQLKLYGHLNGYWREALEADDSILFLEGLTYGDLVKEISEADVSISSSWYESFPLPPIEAMAAGVPVLTTQLGTEEYAIHGETCLVYSAGDSDDAAKKLILLLESPELRSKIIRGARAKIAEFTWSHAFEVRGNWLLSVSKNRQVVQPKRIAPREHSTITQPPSLNDCLLPGLYLTEKGYVFQVDKVSAKHLHSPADVEKIAKKRTSEIQEISITKLFAKWFI
jgi:glycosyltransferase involved in cell wall biosynthesis